MCWIRGGVLVGFEEGRRRDDVPTCPTMLKPTGISFWDSSGRIARIISTGQVGLVIGMGGVWKATYVR